jgi:chaperonin GroEL
MGIVKDVEFDNKARKKLMTGIDKIGDAVKSTLGARGRTVLIESEQHIGGLTVTKDGVTVARSLTLLEPTENLAVQMMRQAAANTATTAGDGTTTAIVLAQSMIHAAEEFLTPNDNLTEVLRRIRHWSSQVVKRLERRSRAVTDKNLRNVATISANNDKEIGSIIYDAYKAVGDGGVVTVENSRGGDTRCEVTKGMKFTRGFTSHYFITDERNQSAVLDKPYILLTDQEISNISNYEQILEPIIKSGQSLLIIGNMGASALSTLTINKVKGTIKVCNIIPPQFGYKTDELMQDIAIATGGRYLSEKMGSDATLVTMDDLGRASKSTTTAESTVIVGGKGDRDAIDKRIADVKALLEEETQPGEITFLEERLSVLTGGVGVIYVGAQSDIEQKEKKDRVDDAVCATKAAVESGILPGGGIALLEEAKALDEYFLDTEWTYDDVIAKDILVMAMKAPFEQININAGFEPSKIASKLAKRGWGYDVKNEKYGSMISMGIIDPAKVTITALENAVSVATTILSTNAIITNVRDI